MKDPLQSGSSPELFNALVQLCVGRPLEQTLSAAVNLMVNAVRQDVATRKQAEAIIDELIGKAKTTLLDQHYDTTTGLRKSVFPFTQRLQMPFHNNESEFFHGR
jgi:hypothetical protein